MANKTSFGHDVKTIAKTLKNMKTDISVAENALNSVKGKLDFVKDVADEIHKTVMPHLPEDKEEDK